MKQALLGAAIGAAAVSTASLALGIAFAKRVVSPSKPKTVKVIAASRDVVVLPRDLLTAHRGVMGLWWPDGHAIVGEVDPARSDAKQVTRHVLAVRGTLPAPGERAIWEGDSFDGPTAVSPDAEDITIDTDLGAAPAWLFPGTTNESTWVIHVHGIRASRVNALRTVPAALEVGCTSLVCSYRGDGEGPNGPRPASTLGLDEWHDIDAAMRFAVERGATSIVLVGWSMGASIVLLAAERSALRHLVRGLVLVSPATEWRRTMANVAGKMGLPFPNVCARLAEVALTRWPLTSIVGLSGPVDLDQLDWTARNRVTVPSLVIHSAGDRKIPFDSSLAFVAQHPDTATLWESSGADHAWEYNVDAQLFTSTVAAWLRARIEAAAEVSPQAPTDPVGS
ncbi:alpha/beta hydrolase [Rathayibacter sp. VKM Ac-2754]|uniref:alpha/beta hydrolase n=1 Tax=Rathayibacter sp. VKM Ac-2754 TaxID=2609251 RepID=UPI001356FE1B|nr:alpha/beta fold hydrolase [Rathayibacter sp. VKM Ac-2754]MWV60852.1 alpha/beta fold hydrolase [Rathayibacter sp. VKM Ac-2754]